MVSHARRFTVRLVLVLAAIALLIAGSWNLGAARLLRANIGIAPTITAISPNHGPAAGGTTVTLTGTGFTPTTGPGAMTGDFGGVAATVTFVSPTSATIVSPAGPQGAVNIHVTTPAGTSSGTDSNKFSYADAPTITGLSPHQGPTLGGTSVTITGTHLTTVSAVDFGGAGGTNIVVNSDASLTVDSPAHGAGTVDVRVTNPAATSVINAPADQYTFVTPPAITSVAPNHGPAAGGTAGGPWYIHGSGFTGTTSVTFGGSAASGYAVSDAQITVTTLPAYTSGDPTTVDVVVTTANGGDSAIVPADQFTWDFSAPTVTSVVPNAGPVAGGNSAVIHGTNFTGASAVFFGPTDTGGLYTVNSDTQITVTTVPAGTGIVDVQVTNPASQTSAANAGDKYTYAPVPTVTNLAPTSGPAAGGTSVTITGTGFYGGGTTCDVTSVTFGGSAATSVGCSSNNSVTATSPSGTPGAVNVVVTTHGGPSSGGPQFTYVAAPTITTIDPNHGTTLGGTVVTINGTGYQTSGTTHVTFGGTEATAVTAVNANTIHATTAAHTKGLVDVVVTNPDAQTATASNGFTYIAPPTITTVSPSSGPAAGGQTVTLTGTDFQTSGTTTVTIGGSAATAVVVDSPTSLHAKTPAHAAASGVDVTVTNPDGQAATKTAAYSFIAAPTVSSVSPSSGLTGGGEVITITGAGYFGGGTACDVSAVSFGGTAANLSGLTNCTDISFKVAAPPHAGGVVDVQVSTTHGGTSTVDDSGCPGGQCAQYTYNQARPVISSVSPPAGPVAGGTVVTVNGSNFTGVTDVAFGTKHVSCPSATCTINSDSKITVTSPAQSSAGQVDITATAAGLTSTTSSSDLFSYAVAPTVTGLSPNHGPEFGDTAVTITGTGFFAGTGSCDITGIKFGTHAADTISCVDDTHATVDSPAGSGVVDVTVTTDAGTSTSGAAADKFHYVPTVASLDPNRGPLGGGTVVTVIGSGFFGGTGACDVSGVKFGTVAATAVACTDNTHLHATSPAHAVGSVDVTVTTSAGTSDTGSDTFTYVAAPTVASVSPNSGTITGGTSVTITGGGFFGGTGGCNITSVKFGSTPATGVSCTDDGTATATSPEGNLGIVDVVVTTDGGPSATSNGDHFRYTQQPAITSVSPNRGPIGGGNVVTVHGSRFFDGDTVCHVTDVTFSGNSGTNLTGCTDTSIQVTVPAHAVGQVDVEVITDGGDSPTAPADHYTYVAPTKFYFAEGFTGDGYTETLHALIPNHDGTAKITYFRGSGSPIVVTRNLLAGQTFVEDVNAVVGPNQPVSAEVDLSDVGVVERQMNFNNGVFHGATDEVGTNAPATEWDFAEGSTATPFYEYLSLQNPNSSATTATINYVTTSGASITKTVNLPKNSRTTISVRDGQPSNTTGCNPSTTCGIGQGVAGVSAQVLTGLPIVAERPMYSAGLDFGSGPIRDGHDAFGANSAGTAWNFAEGTTNPGYFEYLTLQNPDASNDAAVTLTYLTNSGGSITKTLVVGAHTRATVEVFNGNETNGVACNPEFHNCGVGRRGGGGIPGVSVAVTSDNPIVAERPMYMYFGGGLVLGQHDAVGATTLQTIFTFANIDTLSGDYDYFTIQNPGSSAATVTVKYFFSGNTYSPTVNVPAHSRVTVDISNAGAAGGLGSGLNNVGAVLTSDQPVLVEKPSYSSRAATYGATDTQAYSPESIP